MTIAFVYKWTHKPTLRWYIGSRTAKGCHPDDGYICSSKIVKPMILKNPDEWERTIIEVGSPKTIRMLETEILELLDAENDNRSFNQNNGNGKFGMTGKKFTKEHKQNLSQSIKVKMNEEAIKTAISNKLTGRKTNIVPKTAFKKSHTPWNKGLKFANLENHPWKNNGKKDTK